jgi:hypothetical protein
MNADQILTEAEGFLAIGLAKDAHRIHSWIVKFPANIMISPVLGLPVGVMRSSSGSAENERRGAETIATASARERRGRGL